MSGSIDFSTLSWVKQELDATLTQARQALEAHVENPEDDTQLRFCALHLHQVFGTLQMVELYGASLLAEEMEKLVLALQAGKVNQQQEAHELLMRGLLQLPDYLDRILGGQRDIPLVLLPLLNDLRAIQGENLLSENALFTPDLSRDLPPMEVDAAADAQALAKQHRHTYQVALLSWFRDQNTADSLQSMQAVMTTLQTASQEPAVRRLWWVAGAVLQALGEGLLDASMATKLLLGQVDRQIKRLLDEGEAALAEKPALDLFKNLLFYVARARRGAKLVDQVKDTYRLDLLLPDADELTRAEQSLTGHNLDLMTSVSAAVKEDLAAIKDLLDLQARGTEGDDSRLQTVADSLGRIGDTLGMLGLGALRKRMQDQAEQATAMAEGRQTADEDAMMDIAGAMLYVEASLDAMVKGDLSGAAFVEEANLENNSVVPESEFQQVRNVVAEEAIRDIGRAKDDILAYIETPAEFALLDQVPVLFNQIKGGMLLINENRAARVLDYVSQYVQHRVMDAAQAPDEATLDHLADAISAVEYYLENLREQKLFSSDILKAAEHSLEALGIEIADAEEVGGRVIDAAPAEEISVQGVASDATEAAETASANADDEIITISADVGEPDAGEPEDEIITISAAAAESDAGDDDIIVIGGGAEQAAVEEIGIETVELDEAEVEALENITLEVAAEEEERQAESNVVQMSARETAAEVFETPYPVLDNDDLDEEILEIFIEEAEEEVGNIREWLPQWLADADNKDSLTDSRRSFHTLKGSGRLVGAMLIGEFAWAFENMFNRLIEGTIERSDIMCSLLEKVMEALPELIEQIKGGPAPSWDVLAMMAAADSLSKGETIELGELRRAAAPADAVPAEAESIAVEAEAAEPEEEEAPTFDPVLYDIFSNESEGHIASIRAFIEQARADGDSRISEDLLRAVHTLNGSAHMAGAEPVAVLAGELERYAKTLQTESVSMPEAGMDIMAEAMDQVETIIPLLQDAGAELPDYLALKNTIAALPRTAEALGIETVSISAEQPAADEESMLEAFVAGRDTTTAQPEPAVAVAESVDDYDDADEDLIEVFLEEGDEILENAETTLINWMKAPDDPALMAEMQRDLHTLKGGARMANLAPIGDLTHSLESLLIAVTDGLVKPSEALFDRLQQAQDRLVHMLEAVKNRQPLAPAEDLIAEAEALRRGESLDAEPAVVEAAAPVESAPAVATIEDEVEVVDIPPLEMPESEAEDRPAIAARGQQEQVRIRADVLDDMVNNAGEISIYRSRLEQQIGSYRFNLGEMTPTLARLRDQLRKMEIETEAQVMARHERTIVDETHPDFDPLEMDRYSTLQTLSRSMGESINDLLSIQGMLDNITRESETLLVQQSRVNTELQESLMRTRMVPFSRLAPRMRRIVRQVCQELGKRAELALEGAEGEMDRTVIERITAPLEHMLRNAIAHGIESPEERQAAGKPAVGTIKVALKRDASDVVIEISDDGRGMDLARIREKAIEKGFMTADAQLTDNDVMQFVLETGFSTADSVSQIAGRGVGMDVVNSEVKQLGGSLHIDSAAGQGTHFSVRLPFTLAISQALLVQVYETTYAIPLTGIEGVVRMSAEQLQDYYRDPEKRFEYAGYSYEVRHLGNMLGHGETPSGAGMAKRLPVLLVRAGDHHMALQVEALLGSRETVVKSVGPQISSVRGISGATILGDGRVIFILDLGGLVRGGTVTALARHEATPVAEPEHRQPLVMVVDDSITVRKVTTRLLERNDLQSITAKDGVDAVAKLQEHMPDVMLLDIEMPRMDGFELATHIRNEPRLQHIPIIMITSRTGEKHRNRAMAIGVNRYLGKPYQESDLLDNIHELLEERRNDG